MLTNETAISSASAHFTHAINKNNKHDDDYDYDYDDGNECDMNTSVMIGGVDDSMICDTPKP